MLKALRTLWKDEDGLTTVEYALLLVLVVIVGITAWQTLGGNISAQVDEVTTTISGPPGT